MSDDQVNIRELAETMLDVTLLARREDQIALMRTMTTGPVGSAMSALAAERAAEIREANAALQGAFGAESGPVSKALVAANQERLDLLERFEGDFDLVRREAESTTAPAAVPDAGPSGHCPRCGSPSAGGLCAGCLDHDRFVEQDNLAHSRALDDLDYQRVQDDHVRDQQTYFDTQDSWRDD